LTVAHFCAILLVMNSKQFSKRTKALAKKKSLAYKLDKNAARAATP